MSLKLISQRIIVAGILASAIGIAQAQPPTPAATPATAPSAAPPADATAPAVIQIPASIVTVDGTGLSSSEFIMDLYAIAGPRVLEEQINLMAAREACRLNHLSVEQKDLDAETDQLVKNLSASIVPPPTKELTKEEKGNILGQFAQSQGLHPLELALKLQQTAYLRALGKAAKDPATGKPAVNVTDEALNDEFERENGDRANVMIYVFPDREAAQAIVSQATASKKTFPAVADEKRIQRQPVVIPTSDSVKFEPSIFKDIIKQVKEKDISAVTAFTPPDDKNKKTVYVVLYLDSQIAKTVMTADKAKTEKDNLKARMVDSTELQVGLNIVNSLRADKTITVVIHDPTLSQYYEQLQAAQAAQRDAALKASTTQPATGAAAPGR